MLFRSIIFYRNTEEFTFDLINEDESDNNLFQTSLNSLNDLLKNLSLWMKNDIKYSKITYKNLVDVSLRSKKSNSLKLKWLTLLDIVKINSEKILCSSIKVC